MPTKIVVDCSTGISEEVELTAEEIAQMEADAAVFALCDVAACEPNKSLATPLIAFDTAVVSMLEKPVIQSTREAKQIQSCTHSQLFVYQILL